MGPRLSAEYTKGASETISQEDREPLGAAGNMRRGSPALHTEEVFPFGYWIKMYGLNLK